MQSIASIFVFDFTITLSSEPPTNGYHKIMGDYKGMAKFCDNCGSPIIDGSMPFCPKCGAKLPITTPLQQPTDKQKESQKENSEEKSPFVALLCSFFVPGLGQVYNGETAKGLAIFFGTLIGLFIVVIPGLIVWIYGMYDGYSTAKKMNSGEVIFKPTKLT
ncbi:MAG: zinc ribbon domain-containing protein [Methanoregula sp.]|nr:zinc ribbon domain-containing protein [Methanoregula sp.]